MVSMKDGSNDLSCVLFFSFREPLRIARGLSWCNLHHPVKYVCGALAVFAVRCIDFVYYYPAQPIPFGSCGLGNCNGSLDSAVALDDDSTLNRTFGIVDTCTEALGEVCTALVSLVIYSPYSYSGASSMRSPLALRVH